MNQLKKFRIAADLTQAQLAAKLGVSQPNYQRWETGASPIPEDRLPKLAKLLKTTSETILGRRLIEALPSPFPAGDTPATEHYYGEVAIHFQYGKPLLLSISMDALDRLHAQLGHLGSREGDSFITVKSLCNQTAVIRAKAIADIYFTFNDMNEELGGFGPDADDYEYEGVHLPDPRDWHIIDLFSAEMSPDQIIKEGHDQAAVERIGRLLWGGERIPGASIVPEGLEAQHAERLRDFATQTVYQLSNGKRRSVKINESTFVDPIASLVEDPAIDDEVVRLVPTDAFERSIFINLRALDYMTVPTHAFEAAILESDDDDEMMEAS